MPKGLHPHALSSALPPWAFFFIFLFSSLLLSYFHFSPGVKMSLGILGVLCPFLWAMKKSPPLSSPDGDAREFLPPPRAWVWVLLAGITLFTRFYHLTSLSVWPGYDEGMLGFAALELSKKWDWLLFYSGNDSPMGYVWGLGLLDRIMGPSLATLWLLPALVSLFTVPLAFLAARQFFSRSFSLLAAFWVAGSFWPIYLARYSVQPNLVPLWACVSFWLLGRFLKAPSAGKWVWGGILGVGLGLGFYSYISFAPLAAALALMVGTDAFRRRNFGAFVCFLTALLLALVPLGVGARVQGIGHYLGSLWAFSGSLPLRKQGMVSLSYLLELFWGLEDSAHSYRPVWGGFLNPVLDSLFLLGLLQALQNLSRRISQWLLAALFLALFPALATTSLEPFRMVPALVILPLFCIQGLRRLLITWPPSRAAFAAGVLLLFSFGLDFYHLSGPYQHLCRDTGRWYPYLKSVERYRAYQILEPLDRTEGPGFVFAEFVPGFCDETLAIASYAFNAAENPRIAPEKISWAAVLVNACYRPFLAKRFPDGKAYYLSKGLGRPNGGAMLWVMPTAGRGETLQRWGEADASLRPYIHHYLTFAQAEPFQKVAEDLAAAYPSFQGDRFLESCFWEKMADAELKMDPPNFQAAVGDLGKGIQRGYPSANLYYDIGVDGWMDGHKADALRAFQRARKAPGDLTNPGPILSQMGTPP